MRTKTFDAVKLMRELRDKLSQEMEHMTPEARVRHIRDRAASTALGKTIAEAERNAAQRNDVPLEPRVAHLQRLTALNRRLPCGRLPVRSSSNLLARRKMVTPGFPK